MKVQLEWLEGPLIVYLLVATGLASAAAQGLGGDALFAQSAFVNSRNFPDGANPEACDGIEAPTGDIQRLWGWNFMNSPWCFRASYDEELALSYISRPHDADARAFGPYVNDLEDDGAIKTMTAQFAKAAKSQRFSADETVAFISSFVQSMPYTSDSVTTGADEYVRYPVETLIANGGDCEDTSILLAAMLKELGFAVVLVSPPGHLGVGVGLKAGTGMAAFEFEGMAYAYVETTGAGWQVGDVPPEYEQEEVEVYTV